MRYNVSRDFDTQPPSADIDISALTAHLKLLEEENRWLKAQLFGRSSEKTPREDRTPTGLAVQRSGGGRRRGAPRHHIPAHERNKRGRKRLFPACPAWRSSTI